MQTNRTALAVIPTADPAAPIQTAAHVAAAYLAGYGQATRDAYSVQAHAAAGNVKRLPPAA